MENAQDAQKTDVGGRLNHVEFVHRPNEGELAIGLFEAIGCSCYTVDVPPYGQYVVVQLDDAPGKNDMFASQVEPEQLELEEALGAQLEVADSALAAASEQFRSLQRERPFRATHVGLRLPSVGALDATIERLERLQEGTHSGRLEVGPPMSRSAEEAASMSAPLKQVWIWTDVISTGLLSIGQQFELQAYSE
jgi:hypothetical protein